MAAKNPKQEFAPPTDQDVLNHWRSELNLAIANFDVPIQKQAALISRLIDVVGFYQSGSRPDSIKGKGRPPSIDLRVLLHDCSKALGEARGQPEAIWQKDLGEAGKPESDAIRLARSVAKIAGWPLLPNLRRQIPKGRGIAS